MIQVSRLMAIKQTEVLVNCGTDLLFKDSLYFHVYQCKFIFYCSVSLSGTEIHRQTSQGII